MQRRTLFAAALAPVLLLAPAAPASAQNADTERTTVVTPGEDGPSWETTGHRETLRGRSVDYEATGSRTRDGEGGASSEGTRQWSGTGRDGEERTRTVDWERDKDVTRNDDGSITVDKSWEKTHQESGQTASGSKSVTYTRTDDGWSYEGSGERTGFDGRSASGEASGSKTRNEDGVVNVNRQRTVTNDQTGNSRTRQTGATRTPNGDGSGSFTRYKTTTRRDADGNVTGWRNDVGGGEWRRNDQGGRDFRYEGTTVNDRGRSSDVRRRGETWRGDGERGARVRSERTFDDGRSVRRGHERKVQRDGNTVQRSDRHRTRRTPPQRRRR